VLADLGGEGYTAYRLRCKDGKYITIQTKGYLEINQNTGNVDSFLCINMVVK